MKPLNLSEVEFTRQADKVYSDSGIFNPAGSNVRTLKGADEIVGNNYVNSDLGFGVFVDVASQNLDAVASRDIGIAADVIANGIDNQGSIRTNRGRDIVNGTATAEIAAVAQTVSEAMAYADELDTNVIAETFANVQIGATANGINNSGELITGKGSDSVDGEITGSVSAVATATADATAIVECIAEAPVDESVTAFAGAIAQSLANATIAATGINNTGGRIATQKGADTITATAASDSATFAEVSSLAFSAATDDNQALALAVAEAIAATEDRAIAIDNTSGNINLGKGTDTIKATANAADKAIAIDNTNGTIETGKGADNIKAYATGLDTYGIFGGTIKTGRGSDSIEASSFGGGVNIKTGEGKDFVKGFGDATVNGGNGFDIFSFGSYNLEDFNISLGASHKNEVKFERDGIMMTTTKFEQFDFGNGSSILSYDELIA